MFWSSIAIGLEKRVIWKGSPMDSSLSDKFGGAYRYPPLLDISRYASVFKKAGFWAIAL